MVKFVKSIFILTVFAAIIASNSLNLFAEVAKKINGIPMIPKESVVDQDVSKELTSNESNIDVTSSTNENDKNYDAIQFDLKDDNLIANGSKIDNSLNIMNNASSDFPSSSKESSNDWKLAAFLAAAAAAGIAIAASTTKKGGVRVAQKDRAVVLNEINTISAKKYILDDEGYLLEDKFAKIDEKGSKTASDVLDKLIIAKCEKIIATSKSYEKILTSDGNGVTKQIDGGEIIGDDSTGYVIFQEPGKVSGIGIMHEMAHAAGNGDAIDVENKIRSELGLEKRNISKGSEGMFFRELNEGEGYLEEFAKKIDGNITFDKNTETAFVDSSGARGDFRNGEDGTYVEPETNKFVVRQKQFKYKMNMDIDNKTEVYLRSAIGEMNGVIEWVETEKKAVIAYIGKTYDVKIGDFGTRIVNDRLVISKADLAKMLEINESDVSQGNYSNDFEANNANGAPSGGNTTPASGSGAVTTPNTTPTTNTTPTGAATTPGAAR